MPVEPAPLRVAILNDYPIVVAGLTHVMALHPSRIRVVEVDSPQSLPADIDIVLCDTFAIEPQGILGFADLVRATPAKVVLFAGDLSGQTIATAMQAGVPAYISKHVTTEVLVTTLEAIHRGEHVPPPTFDGSDVPGVGSWPGRSVELSSREAEIIAYIARGYTNEEIARGLFLSINSIKTYIRSAYRKIGVERRTQAVLWAMEHGFVSAPARRPDDRSGDAVDSDQRG